LTIARIVFTHQSESIASIFDIVSAEGLHYVVMEHVEGPTLEELVSANGPLPVERVLRIAASLIASLEQLWESAHVVHRNLKSSTIRLAVRGVAKITDFSLAIQAGPVSTPPPWTGQHRRRRRATSRLSKRRALTRSPRSQTCMRWGSCSIICPPARSRSKIRMWSPSSPRTSSNRSRPRIT
jgi:serine/threonine protein kinase